MFHLSAYYLATLNSATLTDIPAVTDQILTIQNSHFLPQEPLNVLSVGAYGATLLQAQLNSPKIRQINPSYVRPINGALLPASNAPRQIFPPGTLTVNNQEELQFLANNSAGGAEHTYGLLWLSDQIVPVPIGDQYTCYFTATGTAVVGSWTQLTMSLQTLLPNGRYCMIGSEMFSTNGIAHRWTFDNQYFRPGNVMMATQAQYMDTYQYQPIFGAMGYFYTYALPRLEVLCDAANTTFTGYFTVIRTGENAMETLR